MTKQTGVYTYSLPIIVLRLEHTLQGYTCNVHDAYAVIDPLPCWFRSGKLSDTLFLQHFCVDLFHCVSKLSVKHQLSSYTD